MSLSNNNSAASRTSIFETFNAPNFDADSADYGVGSRTVLLDLPPPRVVKSVSRRTFDDEPNSPQFEAVEEFEEGGATDDVECIEEEGTDATLFMSCSPGRVSSSESDVEIANTDVNIPISSDKSKASSRAKRKEPSSEKQPSSKSNKQAGKAKQGEKQSKAKDGKSKKSKSEEARSDDESRMIDSLLMEPKKPLSAYALFYRDTQSTIKAENPKATFSDVSRIVASMWDNLEKVHKQVYNTHAEGQQEIYREQLKQYKRALKHEQRGGESHKKSSKSSGSHKSSSSSQKSSSSKISPTDTEESRSSNGSVVADTDVNRTKAVEKRLEASSSHRKDHKSSSKSRSSSSHKSSKSSSLDHAEEEGNKGAALPELDEAKLRVLKITDSKRFRERLSLLWSKLLLEGVWRLKSMFHRGKFMPDLKEAGVGIMN